MVKVGDTVRYLNAVGGGKVVRISGNIAYVDEDGFETPVLVNDLVVVATATHSAPTQQRPTITIAQPAPPKPQPVPVEEVDGGDVLNLVLGFEADDLKRISQTTFAAYLVNDSNYYVHVQIMRRRDDDSAWSMWYSDIIEPNIQEYVGEVMRDDIPLFEHIAVQYLAYKPAKPFALKNPALVETKFDVTKFFKLHSFQKNRYFDAPVITLDIVKNDLPYRYDWPQRIIDTDVQESKKRADMRRSQPAPKPRKAPAEPLVVDLHINQLLDSTAGLSNADMLNYQIDTFRRVMDQNLKNRGMKIIFIHGKGEGVLRQAILKELNHKYKGHDVQDASFREYGFGATQVTI